MLSLLRRSRYLPRIRRVVTALTRHGLGWLADQVGLSRFLSWPRRLFRRETPQPLPSLAQRLCRALEELGPSFVLLGRYLSTRVDLLPLDLCHELRCLAPRGPVLAGDVVAQILQEDLGQPLEELFAEFTPDPWRCTWLEQVHCARTPEGQQVWVTVLNEQVRAQLERERPVLQELALMIEETPPPGRQVPATAVVRQFEEVLRQEFDLRERGRNAERWQRQFTARGQPVFPTIDWQRTGVRVLTYEALPGLSLEVIADVQLQGQTGPSATGVDVPSSLPTGPNLARALYQFFGEAVVQDGFYPAPPSLGGLVVLDDGRLAVTTLAPVGYLDSSVRRNLLSLLEHFRAEAIDEILDKAASLGMIERREVSTTVYQAARHLIDRYHDLPLSELRLQVLAEDLFALASRGVIDLPEEILLLLGTLVAVENLGKRLAPHVSAGQSVAALVQHMMAAQHSWKVRQERLLRSGQAWVEALTTLPVDLRHLFSQAVQGDLLLGVEPRSWQRPMRRLERMVYRLVLSVVAAGLLIALALLVTTLLPPSWGPWGWILAAVALFSLLGLGLLLVLSFLRRR